MIYAIIKKDIFDNLAPQIKKEIRNVSGYHGSANIHQENLSGTEHYIVKGELKDFMNTHLRYCNFYSRSEVLNIIDSGVYTEEENQLIKDKHGYYWFRTQRDEENPFASNVIPEGSLYKRMMGSVFTVVIGQNNCDFSVPYPVMKIKGLKVINCSFGDSANLKILDDASGTYSTVPNYLLNQFGFNVPMPAGTCSDSCNYDADLYFGMIVRLEFTSISAKTIGVHYDLHEVKQ